MFGSPEEKSKLSQTHYKEARFQMNLKSNRLEEEKKRDSYHTEKCQEHFLDECERARQAEILKREMRKRVAEENLMLASNKKR